MPVDNMIVLAKKAACPKCCEVDLSGDPDHTPEEKLEQLQLQHSDANLNNCTGLPVTCQLCCQKEHIVYTICIAG